MWRSEDWEEIKENNRQKASEGDWEREDIFEAGADAMLEALKKMDGIEILVAGEWYKAESRLQIMANNDINQKGRVVFIPNEETE